MKFPIPSLLLALAFATTANAQTLRIGVTTGSHAEIFEVVKTEAAKTGLDLKIIEFSDYVQPNAALAAGELDANSYQHQPYLDATNADRGYTLVSVGKSYAAPIGIYSRRVKSLSELPQGAKIAIPNDPTNGGRSLLLLQREGVIGLDAAAGLRASPLDVTKNPKKLRFIELDAAQLPRSLADVDAAAVNTNYALEAGLKPTQDAIARESADSDYVNVIAVRAEDKDKPWVKTLVAAYHSEPVRTFILERYEGALIPAW